MNTKKLTLKLSILTALLMVSFANANTLTTNIQTNATLNPSCRINAITSFTLDFTPTPTAIAKTSIRPFVITCSNGWPYTLGISAGASANILDRTMTSAGTSDVVHYNIYTDNTYTTIFGDGITGSTIAKIGNGGGNPNLTYMMLWSNQFVVPSNYSDILTLIITY